MSKVRVHNVEELAWTTVGAMVKDPAESRLPPDHLAAQIVYHEPGADDAPQLFEMIYLPDTQVEVHAHDEDEIIYVLDGELQFGTKALKAGSSVFIKGGAFYSFQAGPEGLRFLNFRPRSDMTYHRKGG